MRACRNGLIIAMAWLLVDLPGSMPGRALAMRDSAALAVIRAERLDLDHAIGIEPAAHRGGDRLGSDGAIAQELGREPVRLLSVEHVALDDLGPAREAGQRPHGAGLAARDGAIDQI